MTDAPPADEPEDSAGCSRLLLLFAALMLLVLAGRAPLIHWAGRETSARVTLVDDSPAGPIAEIRVHYEFETVGGDTRESVYLRPRDALPQPVVGDEFDVRYFGPLPFLHDRADRSPGLSSLLLALVTLLLALLALRPGGSPPKVNGE